MLLKSTEIETPLGVMTAIGDEKGICYLGFSENQRLAKQIKQLEAKQNVAITSGEVLPFVQLRQELTAYFKGELKHFKTPIHLFGTDFQIRVWKALQAIPYRQSCSYLTLAETIDQPKAYRAVARANATNKIAIIVPCHRVINHNGQLGGYLYGLDRKKWLLAHENGECYS